MKAIIICSAVLITTFAGANECVRPHLSPRRTHLYSSQPHLYPICFYLDARPTQDEYNSYYVPKLIEALRASAGLSPNTRIVASPDGRWLIADATTYQNSRAAALWARIACIGNAPNSDKTMAEQTCTAYIKDFVTQSDYFKFDKITISGNVVIGESVLNQNVLHCRTIETKSDP